MRLPRILTKRRKTLTVAAILAVAVLSPILGYAVWAEFFAGPNCSSNTSSSQGRVALIDQLSLQHPNPDFVAKVADSVSKAGTGLDYFQSRGLTVDFFTNLPGRGYSIIIFRTHGAVVQTEGPTVIATSESYSSLNHIGDQWSNRVTSVNAEGSRLFALMPEFVANEMCGTFPGTIVLTMFCSSGTWTSMAEAFIQKGAAAYVGWDGPVTLTHTDQAFEMLTNLLLTGSGIDDAVQNVMSTLGPDPLLQTRLSYYAGPAQT